MEYEDYATRMGYDPADPEVQQTIAQLKQQFPDTPPEQVVQQVSQFAQSGLGAQAAQAGLQSRGLQYDPARLQEVLGRLSQLGSRSQATAQYDERAARADLGERFASAFAPTMSAENRAVRDKELLRAKDETEGRYDRARQAIQADLNSELAVQRGVNEAEKQGWDRELQPGKVKGQELDLASKEQGLKKGEQEVKLNEVKLEELKAARADSTLMRDPNSEISVLTRSLVTDNLKKLGMTVPGIESMSAAQLEKLPNVDKMMDNHFRLLELQARREERALTRQANENNRAQIRLTADQAASAKMAENASKLEVQKADYNMALAGINRLKGLAERLEEGIPTAGSWPARAWGDVVKKFGGEATSSWDQTAASIRGQLSKQVAGPGALSDQEQKLVSEALGTDRMMPYKARMDAIKTLEATIRAKAQAVNSAYEQIDKQRGSLETDIERRRTGGAPAPASSGVVDFNSLK